ncbi:unnamed protein product [Parajaminaea phylloscopi]
MPIRTRTTTDFFDVEKKDETAVVPQFNPVSIGSASKPVHWSRANKPARRVTERPAHTFDRKRPQPVVDGSESFLGVLLPRPSVNVTRSSYSDITARDARATQDFQRPVSSKGYHGKKQKARPPPSDPLGDSLAPDFAPIELVSVELLFREPQEPIESRPVEPLRLQPSGLAAASAVSPSEVSFNGAENSLLAPPSPVGPPAKRRSSFFPRLSSRLSFRTVSEVASPTSPIREEPLPAVSLASRKAAATPTSERGDADAELAPPLPQFIREGRSSTSLGFSKNKASSDVGRDKEDRQDRASSIVSASPSRRSASALALRSKVPTPSESAPRHSEQAFHPKMTTILSRFSSRQMGDHKCKRGYPIAVFCGAQSMDVGSITNPKIEGGFSLFFGPGHPANTQQTMTESEKIPSHLQNPKAPSTTSTARRAELIAATRALQAIHDLYQGKACAHICMDSPYVAKAWGSWIPMWEETGWPGDEHIRTKDSGYQGSGATSLSDAQPRKRSSKRLADEDLLRQLAAIRRLYARAERKGTGAAHLYLIDRNSNPANQPARQVLENAKAKEFVSPTHSPADSRRHSLQSPRGSMYALDTLGSPRASRHRSVMSTSSRRSSRDLLRDTAPEDGRGSRLSTQGQGRTRTRSAIKPAPAVEEVEETPTEVVADATAQPAVVLAPRPPSIKSAASAVTALSDNEDGAKSAGVPRQAKADAPASLQVPASAEPVETERRGSDGFLAAAAASAAAFVAGVTGSSSAKDNAEAAVPEESAVATAGDADAGVSPTAVKEAVIEDPGVAVPEEPKLASPVTAGEAEAALVLAPALDLPLGQSKADAAEPAAAPAPLAAATSEDLPSSPQKPAKTPVAAQSPPPAVVVPVESPRRGAAKSPLTISTAAASPKSADRSGRLINYSSKKRMSSQKAAVSPVKTDVRTASDSTDAEPVLSETDELSSPADASSSPRERLGLTAATLAARSETVKPVEREEATVAAPADKTLKKQQSLPAARKKAAGGDRASVISSSSSLSRRFRSLGQFGRPKNVAAAPEDEVWAREQDKKARRKTMKWFQKEDAPPLPTSGGASPRNGQMTPDEKVISVVEPVGQRRSMATGRHRRQPTEQSIFEDDDEDAGSTPIKGSKSKTSKAPKAPKEPKEPKEPFSFKRSMSKLMTME